MPQTFLYGSLIQSGSIPTSALGGGVVSASAQITAQLPSGLVSSSAQLPAGTVSSSAQLPAGTVSSSAQLPAGTVSSSAQLPAGLISGATQFNTVTGTSASFASTASNLVGGAINYIPLWTSTGAQSSSTVYQLSTNVGINNLVPSASLHVSGGLMLQHVYERANITGSAPPATFTLDIASGSIFYRSASTSANWTLNFRGDIATPLNTIMYNGQVLTATVMTIQGATPYSASAIQIDGAAIIPRWQGGTSSSTANGLEVSTYTIIKIASASYNLLASVTRYI